MTTRPWAPSSALTRECTAGSTCQSSPPHAEGSGSPPWWEECLQSGDTMETFTLTQWRLLSHEWTGQQSKCSRLICFQTCVEFCTRSSTNLSDFCYLWHSDGSWWAQCPTAVPEPESPSVRLTSARSETSDKAPATWSTACDGPLQGDWLLGHRQAQSPHKHTTRSTQAGRSDPMFVQWDFDDLKCTFDKSEVFSDKMTLWKRLF